MFMCVSDHHEADTLMNCKNGLSKFFRDVTKRLAYLPAWDMAEFDAARDSVFEMFPGKYDLWEAARTNAPRGPIILSSPLSAILAVKGLWCCNG